MKRINNARKQIKPISRDQQTRNTRPISNENKTRPVSNDHKTRSISGMNFQSNIFSNEVTGDEFEELQPDYIEEVPEPKQTYRTNKRHRQGSDSTSKQVVSPKNITKPTSPKTSFKPTKKKSTRKALILSHDSRINPKQSLKSEKAATVGIQPVVISLDRFTERKSNQTENVDKVEVAEINDD